jgi:O-antigen/teichoic acid export membrane protein
MTDEHSAYRPLYPNIFVRVAVSLIAALAGLFFFTFFIPGIPALWRTIITLAIVFGIGPLIFYWMDHQRGWRTVNKQ